MTNIFKKILYITSLGWRPVLPRRMCHRSISYNLLTTQIRGRGIVVPNFQLPPHPPYSLDLRLTNFIQYNKNKYKIIMLVLFDNTFEDPVVLSYLKIHVGEQFNGI